MKKKRRKEPTAEKSGNLLGCYRMRKTMLFSEETPAAATTTEAAVVAQKVAVEIFARIMCVGVGVRSVCFGKRLSLFFFGLAEGAL